MKNNQKTLVISLLLIIIVLLVVEGGVYIYETKKMAAPVSYSNQNQTTNLQNESESDSLVSTVGWVTGTNINYPADLTATPSVSGTQQGPTYTFPQAYFAGSSITSAKITSYSSCGNDAPATNIVIEGISFSKSADGLTYVMPGACNTAFILTISTGAPSDVSSAAYQNVKNIFYTMIDSMAKKLSVASPQNSTFSASPASGSAPLTVQFSRLASAGDISIDYGDGTSCTTADPDGSENCSVFTHTYTAAGTYEAIADRHLPTMEIGRTTVNVTVGGAASAISVPGMQQYTDSNFGFSFWYPTSWGIEPQSSQKSYLSISGGTLVRNIVVGPANDLNGGILLQEFVSPSMSLTDSSNPGPAGDGAGIIGYRFDPSIHSWIIQNSDTFTGSVTSKVLTTFTNTMGGLHILGGNARFGDDVIVPLSATHFLVISAIDGGGIQEAVLAQTVTATDPSVATPVSPAQQSLAIHAEGLLYGALGRAVGEWYVDNQYVYNHIGTIIAGANPATFRLVTLYSDGFSSTETGYATDGIRVYSDWSYGTPVLAGADPRTFMPIRQPYQIPYTPTSGKYGQSFTSYDTSFAKDASHVWYNSTLIPGADPNTFVVTGDTGVKNSYGGYTLAHDAHHVYGIDAQSHLTIDGVTVE